MSCKFMSAVLLSLFDKPKLKQNQRPFAQPKYQHNHREPKLNVNQYLDCIYDL